MNEPTFYMVNRKTREHKFMVVIHQPIAERRPEWYRVEADAAGWIEWSGGECPLPDGSMFDVITKGGFKIQKLIQDGRDWRHVGASYDIIAYRPITDQPTSEEPKGWGGPRDGLPPVGTVCECRVMNYGQRGDFKPGRVVHKTQKGVALFEFDDGNHGAGYAPGDFRPIRTPREQWSKIVANMDIKGQGCIGFRAAETIYDALASGELEMPARN